jgi:hypothetical protein
VEKVEKALMVTLNEWIPSPMIAKMIGIRPQTLAKWRLTGKGPKGWKRIAQNRVVYPLRAVLGWMEENGLVYEE